MSRRHRDPRLVSMELGKPPSWLKSAHLQTILPALRFARDRGDEAPPSCHWTSPDSDCIDVVRRDGSPLKPALVVFHGLEGSYDSHYARAFARAAAVREWTFFMPHFRGCGAGLNLAPRAYHSGDHEEIDWILRRVKAEVGARPVYSVGISMGGNALMHWAGVTGRDAQAVVSGLAAVSSPLDLTASGKAMGHGFNLHVYTRMFLRTMVPKALEKWAQYPGLFDRERLLKAKTLWEFDNAFTAPVHGFRDAADYWYRASAMPKLRGVQVPSMLLNALNDPFVPLTSLPTEADVSNCTTLWQPQEGGHVGFPARCDTSPWDFHAQAMPNAVVNWLAAHGLQTGYAGENTNG